MNWAHCNRCAGLLEEAKGKTKFFLTNCGHLYCDECLNKYACTKPKCFVCGAINVNTAPFDENLNPTILGAFKPVPSLMKQVYETYEFQESHLRNLAAIYQRNFQSVGSELKQVVQRATVLKNQIHEKDRMIHENELVLQKLRDEAHGLEMALKSMGARVCDEPFARVEQPRFNW